LLAAIAIGVFLAVAGYRLLSRPGIDKPLPGQQTQILMIDLNSATEAELAALPKIGPALAKRIVEDRSVSGPYRSLDDLDRVPGIGPRTIESIRPYAITR
jgi:competence protein ComEA